MDWRALLKLMDGILYLQIFISLVEFPMNFLNGSFVPAFETARGCPFQCTFCDQGLDQNKITSFSSERIVDEMKYVAKNYQKLNSGSKTVAIFDPNFGLFEKDVNLAKYLLEVMNEYDWPQYIEAIAPKSNRENILIINDILKNRVISDYQCNL